MKVYNGKKVHKSTLKNISILFAIAHTFDHKNLQINENVVTVRQMLATICASITIMYFFLQSKTYYEKSVVQSPAK